METLGLAVAVVNPGLCGLCGFGPSQGLMGVERQDFGGTGTKYPFPKVPPGPPGGNLVICSPDLQPMWILPQITRWSLVIRWGSRSEPLESFWSFGLVFFFIRSP